MHHEDEYGESEEEYPKGINLVLSIAEVAMLRTAATDTLETENPSGLRCLIDRLDDILCRNVETVALDLNGGELLLLHRATFVAFAKSRRYPDFTKLTPNQRATIDCTIPLGELAAVLESHLEDLGLEPAGNQVAGVDK